VELIGVIGVFFFALAGIFATAVSRQFADEFKAWTPRLIRHVIQRAVGRLPENQRQRFTEEWHSHVDEIPGEVGKLFVAFGFLRASSKMSRGLTDAAFTMSGPNLNSTFVKRLLTALCHNEHFMSALSDSERISLQREISELNDNASAASAKFEQAMSALDIPTLNNCDRKFVEWFIDMLCNNLELSNKLGIAPTSLDAYQSGDPERLRQAENAFAEWRHAYQKGDPEGLHQAENALWNGLA
jgi:hypothetical protein